ncbi:hypothetical protein MRB53_030680 [Persea americana]|uniref:Uncharacterized protein n=1 Tax=Persea americana TaxID=3435 RepID=A0ACC2KLW0_PERAE|nr:hypothetical protein MRB53_030680 [Persea americana]
MGRSRVYLCNMIKMEEKAIPEENEGEPPTEDRMDEVNLGEYEAIIMGMEIALTTGIKRFEIFGDSKLIVSQINGKYDVRKPDILPYHRWVKTLIPQFSYITVMHIARSLNAKADSLADIAATMVVPEGSHCEIFVKERRLMPDLGTWEAIADCVNNPTAARIGVLPAEKDWRQPFISFLKYGILAEGIKERTSMKRSTPPGFISMKHWDSYTTDRTTEYCSDASPTRKEKGC